MNHFSAEYKFTRGLSRSSLIVAFAALVGLLFTACAPERPPYGPPEPFPYLRFGENLWQEFNVGVDSPDDVIATVIRLWGHDREQFTLTEVSDNRLQMNWPDSNATGLKANFSAKFRDDHLTHITFWWDLPEPALVQVIDCLGPPDYYTASYSTATQGQSIWISLWYVERGFYVSGAATALFPGQLLLLGAIPPGFRMEVFLVLPAGLEEMARNFTYLNDHGKLALCVLKPWPGSVEAIEMEVDLFAPCSGSAAD